MRKLFLFFLLAVLMLSNLYSQQNWIDNCDHIPIHSTVWTGWLTANGAAGAIDSMKKAGVEILTPEVINDNFLQQFTQENRGFIILPGMAIAGSDTLDYINHYTNARYTVWEAEGTPPTVSEAKLEYEDSLMDPIINFIRLKESAATYSDVELIKGPYFQQFVYSPVKTNRWQNNYFYKTDYLAEFNIRLISNNNLPDTVNPNTPICIIQVTQSMLDTNRSIPGWPFNMGCTLVVKDSIITRSKFNLNQFQNFQLNYNLNNGECSLSPEPNPVYPGLTKRDYVQYKVIWLGQSNYLLDIDKVVVSDQSGRDLKRSDPITFANIRAQDNVVTSSQYWNYATGWNGADEPHTIDQFEPMRIVDSLLNSKTNSKRPTWYPLVGAWDGVWENHNNPWGTYHLSIWDELKKRVGPMNVWQDIYYMDWPCTSNTGEYPCDCNDFRVDNIDIAAMNYEKAYNSFPNFGTSIQCGEQYNVAASQRNINSKELLYETNLALLFGTKFISLYTYFAQTDINDPNIISGGTKRAIVDFINSNSPIMSPDNNYTLFYTEKYYTLRDTISLRLKGLMGKTLKKLNPLDQYAGSSGINYYPPTPPENPLSGYQYIEDIFPPVISLNNEYGIDLGFFSDPVDSYKKYFMILNRYYSEEDIYQIYLKNLDTYINWKLTNYVDTTNIYLRAIDNKTMFTDTLLNGDANLYSILPVVKYGGKLIYNETVTGGTTLTEDMSIENGATLTVNGIYNAKANITVKSGGKIIAGTNGKIIFDQNKYLIIDGNAQVNGTSNNRLTLDFNSNTSAGVEVRFYNALTMSYCNINNAMIGINAEAASYINISNVNFTNCQSSGIVLFSFGNGDSNLPSSTSTISKCIINGSSTGISVVNADEVVITENSINNCNLGIYLNQVNSTHISSNNIIGYSYPNGSTMPGILMSSCGGYLRNNTIKYHKYGVQLAYSSPNMGLNTIEQNAQCGLFVDIGSYPNLIQKLVNENCWYPIAGCNIITNNGIEDGPPPMSTEINPGGSEIYLNYGDVKISSGGNEISDDRTNVSSSLTLPLITGIRGGIGTRELYADRNYWGSGGPSSERFGRLNVIYEPSGDFCPLPDAPCSGNEIIIHTSDGLVIDTLESKQRDPEAITTLEESYSNADKLFLSGEIEQAKIIYQQIVAGAYTSEEKLYAYNRLYEIGKLFREDDSYYTNLQTSFENILSTETDTLLIKIYNQNAILCDVGKEEYLTAISKFDNIIQQNPNSEEAVYAEIDIITTALNLDTTNTQLGKMGNGKYLVKGTSDYLSKLNDILQSKFGINSKEKEKIIPKEYSLYPNYPNPFNPTTVISWQSPLNSHQSIKVYDILGKEVAVLVDEFREAGVYEVTFDASKLASGVYIYKLQSGDFVDSKKMILLK